MNADTYLLLNSVLATHSCIDSSLCSTIETNPFAVHCLAQECYYVIYLLSSARALLLDDHSAYKVLLQQLLLQEREVEELKMHYPSLKSVVGELHFTAKLLSRSSTIRSHSKSTNWTDKETADNTELTKETMQEELESYEHAEQNKHEQSTEQSTHPFITAELFLLAGVECHKNAEPKLSLPPVQVSSSLELRLVIIGGGTVCRRLLHMLLASVNDKRDGLSSNGLKAQHGSTLLFHPSRITVITRQPERLSVFAALGVRCVKGTHHYLTSSDVAECDVLCLACQPEHLASVVKTHFTPPCYNDNDDYGDNNTNGHRVMREDNKERVEGERTKWDVSSSNSFEACKASFNKKNTPKKPTNNNFLKQTCVVFSCLAGVSSRKLSTLLHHPQRLILCASLNTLPNSCESEQEQEQRANTPQHSSLSSHASLPLSSEHIKQNINKNLEKLCAPSQKGTCLPALAQLYANEVDSCRALRVQYMADHDSFLHDAVCEAEQIQIHKAAEEIIQSEANANVHNAISSSNSNASKSEESRENNNNGKTQKEFTSLLPEELRYRSAFTSATQATLHSHTAPSIHSFLQTNTVASLEFVCRAWNVVQAYTDLLVEHIMLSEQTSSSSTSTAITVANKTKHKKLEAHKRSSTRITAQATSAVRSNNKHNITKTSALENSEQQKCEEHEMEFRESSTSEISFLCMALAALSPDTHMMLITALRRRYLLEALSEFDDDSYVLNYSNLFPQIALIEKATKQNIIEHVYDKSNVAFQEPLKERQVEHNANTILTQGDNVINKVKDSVRACKLDDDNNQVDRNDVVRDISVTAAEEEKSKEQPNRSLQTKTKQMHRTVCAYLAILMNRHFPFAFASDDQLYDKFHSQYRTILHTVSEEHVTTT